MELTPEGRRLVEDVSQRHGVSVDAVLTLLQAVAAGGGSSAQFNHPELGGMGQWSQGGMIMVGDMFNNALKYRVDQLCNELSSLVRGQGQVWATPASSQSQMQSSGGRGYQGQGQGGVSLFVPGAANPGSWWPAELGAPASTGAQNDLRYACFPATRRLAIQLGGGEVAVYDTGDHQISGFSQQQSGDASFTFTSQHGVVRVADLPRVGAPVSAGATPASPAVLASAPSPVETPAPAMAAAPSPPAAAVTATDDEIFSRIERLADLRQKGILTEEEFVAKKAELLARL